MLNVALTGNVAAGKSTVAQLFRRWGAWVTDADQMVRELQRPGTPVFQQMVAAFGPGVVAPDGTLDRPALRTRVFGDPVALDQLNRIVHPAVHARREELEAAARAEGATIAVHDIPLLFEAGDPTTFDLVVLVDAPVELRRERLIRDRGLSAEQADRMIAAQWPSDRKREASDLVIDNDGDLAVLERRARTAWATIGAHATGTA